MPDKIALQRLLVDMFTVQELDRFLEQYYPNVRRSIPMREAVTDVVFEMVQKMERDGRLDEGFRSALVEVRPRRSDEIGRIWTVVGRGTEASPRGSSGDRSQITGQVRPGPPWLDQDEHKVVAAMGAFLSSSRPDHLPSAGLDISRLRHEGPPAAVASQDVRLLAEQQDPSDLLRYLQYIVDRSPSEDDQAKARRLLALVLEPP
ncbi:MAG: hypothetical protein AAFZ18_33685 [Myxococcota bacterium]